MMLNKQKHLDLSLALLNFTVNENKKLKEENDSLLSSNNAWKALVIHQNAMLDRLTPPTNTRRSTETLVSREIPEPPTINTDLDNVNLDFDDDDIAEFSAAFVL